MKTQTRLTLMFGLLLVVFGTAAWSLREWYDREAYRMLANLKFERTRLLERVLPLTSQSLQNFATDYSNWDEMLAFVHKGDPAWGTINIDASLKTFNVQAAWVLRADGSLVYGATRQLGGDAHNGPPLPTAQILEKLRREKFTGFFVEVPEGLLEIRAAPIQPSSDVQRETEPQGWLLVGQLWNTAYLNTLASILDSTVILLPPAATPKPPPDDLGIHLQRDLTGWDGNLLQRLHLDYRPESLVAPLQNDRYEMIVFCSFVFAIIAFTITAVSYWVLNPLRQLEQSMATNSPAALGNLVHQPDEFGHLAQLATASFAHRATLEREVEERRLTEDALKESEKQVRFSADLRARLARDLHDNVIQSIYATGLGLESIRRTLRTNPDAAELHLDAVRKTLNQLIREIRSFITGMEPENSGRPAQFVQALNSLAATLQSLHPIQIGLDLDPQAAARLSPQEELQTLQIVREGVSNALRHGGATQIDLRLLDQAGVTVLQLEDNGKGFEPAAAAGVGSGLNNLAARAREMGATLKIDSAPGDGTRLNLRFDRIHHA